MKKFYLKVGIICALGATVLSTSCIGSFSLTNQLLDWNKKVSNKFVNELVFIAFCIIPVYEVTALSDILVLNSIEFWSGKNPVMSSSKIIDGRDGKYIVESDKNGYTITSENDGTKVRLNFDENDNSWSAELPEGEVKFMSFIDTNHVKMITKNGNYIDVELSEAGYMAYQALSQNILFAKTE